MSVLTTCSVVSPSGACSVTLTVSARLAIWSTNGSATCDAIGSLTSFRSAGPKPASAALTVYVPGGNALKLYVPSASVTVSRDAPFSWLRAVTVTPGSFPPLESFTSPRMLPVVVWASIARMLPKIARIRHMTRHCGRGMFSPEA